MTCPDCERHKLSASMWRNKAYEVGGTPLPWAPEELLRKEYERGRADGAAAEREACAKVLDEMAVQDKWTNYYAVAANTIRTRRQA